MIELILLFLGAHLEPDNKDSFCYEQPQWFLNILDWNSQGLLEPNAFYTIFNYLFEKGIIYKVDPNTAGCRELGVRPNGEHNI